MSKSRLVSGMASGTVLCPSARVDKARREPKGFRIGREKGTERMEGRDTGSILVDYQTEEL